MASLLTCLSSPNASVHYDGNLLVGGSAFCSLRTRSFCCVGRPKCCISPQCFFNPLPSSLEHIPKRFREENLDAGLAENYKSISKHFYGLTPSQMDMFLREDGPVRGQSGRVTEENISSAWNYQNHGGAWTVSGETTSVAGMTMSLYRSGAGGRTKLDEPPPDLPSLLLDARIVYLGMAIVSQVTELIAAQFLWLDYDDPTKPIYLYINSPGTQNDRMEPVGLETDAYAIADTMSYVKAKVYTINIGMAYGQAAMILAVGDKGHRALQPHASTKLYMPKMTRSSGTVSDAWIRAKELDANTDSYVGLLSKGTGRPKEEIAEDIKCSKYFRAQEAIDYGLADKIVGPEDKLFEAQDYKGGKLAPPEAGKAAGRPAS